VLRNTVVLYRGYGANGKVWVQGRALERYRAITAELHHGRWDNLRAMLQRANADPMPHAVVHVACGDASSSFTADDEGFFSGWMSVGEAEPSADSDWIVLQATMREPAGVTPSTGEAFYPRRAPDQLIISDIDDTVLQSRVTNFLRAAQTLAFGNARTRLPFPGVAAFYDALQRGPVGTGDNPLFYVSSSPWNLYDVITEFLDIQGVPKGPVMLRDLDIGFRAGGSGHHHEHKGANIRRILETYPAVPAILIGDSGQQDPEIYHRVVHDFAGRVRAIYIRNVTMNRERSSAIQTLAEMVLHAGSSLVLADDTYAAAQHAAEQGFIARDALPGIREEKHMDTGETAGKADAPGAQDADEPATPTVVVE
jgi:phosphatidate phosphatase APP1